MVRLAEDPDTAVAHIPAGACVGVGGSVNAGHPMALVRALIRLGTSELTLAGLTAGLELDMLVAAGSCRRLVAAYVGAERLVSLPPAVRWAAEEGRLEIWENEEGVHLASLRARAQRVPYSTWVGGLGTSVMRHPLVEEAFDDRSGRAYLKVRPLEVDVALLWAEAADADGNVLLWGADMGDEALRAAADLRVVQVERLTSTEELVRHPDRVIPWAADVVVRAPNGTHPFAGSSLDLDSEWLLEYAATVSRARQAGDPAILDSFLDRWIRDVEGEQGYFALLGAHRLKRLATA
ncbi:MAG: CoA transferase subunit A [Thermoleophilaceae bacterium]